MIERMRKRNVIGAGLAAIFLASSPVHASPVDLIGEELTVSYIASFAIDPDTVEVEDPGFELSYNDGTNLGTGFLFAGDFVDFTANQVIINFAPYPSAIALHLIVMINDTTGDEPVLTDVTLGSATPGDSVGITFDSGSPSMFELETQFDGNTSQDDSRIVVDLTFAPAINPPPTPTVPLPAGGVLLMAALSTLGFARRRKTV